jgi:hypothetical protein
MKSKILISLVLALNTSVAFAALPQPTPPYTAQVIANACGLPYDCSAYIVGTITGGSPGTFTTVTVTGGNADFTSAGGQPVYPLPAVRTPATAVITPAAGLAVSQVYNEIATAGPTLAIDLLPAMTAQPARAKSWAWLNRSASPLLIQPFTGEIINAGGANTPFSCTAAKLCKCLKVAATSSWCTIE